MRVCLIILFVGFSTLSYQQRPDLTLGINVKAKFLRLKNNNLNYLSPGGDVQLHVNKRSLLGGLNLGYSALFPGDSLGPAPQHLINTDLVIGWMIIRKPSLKIGFNAICSYSVSLNKKTDLQPNTNFNRNNVTVLPEIYLTYKSIRLAYNYSIPVLGNSLYGSGLEIGIRF